MEIASLFFRCCVPKVPVLMDMASCPLPLFTISYCWRAEEKKLAVDAPELHGDHTDRTCGVPLCPPSDSLIVFSIEIDQQGHCECTSGCHIDFWEREIFFLFSPPSLLI